MFERDTKNYLAYATSYFIFYGSINCNIIMTVEIKSSPKSKTENYTTLLVYSQLHIIISIN